MQELCASDQLLHMEDVTDVLARTLSSAQLADTYVAELLDMMASMYPAAHAALRTRVAALRAPGQTQPDELCAPPPGLFYLTSQKKS